MEEPDGLQKYPYLLPLSLGLTLSRVTLNAFCQVYSSSVAIRDWRPSLQVTLQVAASAHLDLRLAGSRQSW